MESDVLKTIVEPVLQDAGFGYVPGDRYLHFNFPIPQCQLHAFVVEVDECLTIVVMDIVPFEEGDTRSLEAVNELNREVPGKFCVNSCNRVYYSLDVSIADSMSRADFARALVLAFESVFRTYEVLMKVRYGRMSIVAALKDGHQTRDHNDGISAKVNQQIQQAVKRALQDK